MPTLTSLLARDGIVSLDTIEQALQRQVLEGGELDTALLELGALPENVLGSYRAATYQLPAAPRAQLEHEDAALRGRVPAELAREHRVVPVGTAGSDGLVLATDAPLPLADAQRLARQLGARLSFRIATEVRVHAALAAFYGAEMPSRLRLLDERLRNADAGELCAVQLWSARPEGGERRTSRPPSRTQASQPGDTPPGVPVRVLPMVNLGERRSSTPASDGEDTRPIRGLRPSMSGSRRGRRSSSVPRGPITRLAAIELLVKARDRDRVLDVFFAFARQYFECTVLFALRDERLLGIEASGLPPPSDVSSLDVPIAYGGAVQALMQTRRPQVLDLRTSAADRPLVGALGREHGQPCAIIPVAIRQRNVAVLYGDRSGDRLTLADVAELIATLPSVTAAFERLIQERKLHAMEAHRQRGPASEPAAPEGTFRPSVPPPANAPVAPVASAKAPPAASAKLPPAANAPPAAAPRVVAPKVPTAPGIAGGPAPLRDEVPEEEIPTQTIPRSGKAGGSAGAPHGDLPPPPRVPAEAMLQAEAEARAANDALVDRPTLQISTDDIRAGLRPSAPPSSTSYSTRTAPMDDVRARRREQERTVPERPSKLPAARPSASTAGTAPAPRDGASTPRARRRSDPPSPRTLSQPPPGTGSYSVRESPAEVVAPRQRSQPPPAAANAEPERDLTRAVAAPPTAARAERSDGDTASAPRGAATSPRSDPRRDDEAEAPTAETVTIPQTVRESLRPARMTPPSSTPSIVVDLASEAERLVDDVCRTGPDEEQTAVAALLRFGDAVLPVLARRFPGPLWFDRNKPRQRMPSGRDVSAIARALHAFGARAIPYVAELLEAKQADVRLCATLLTADCVCPELLAPLYQRLFDPDGQVRLIASETLPAYRQVQGFDETLRSLREKARNQREPIPNRLAALEAISMLRDPASVPLLVELCNHDNRQLSVPAHRSLLAITAQDFGDSERKWKSWFDKNRTRHRVEWLIDSLMHSEERVRTSAGVELQKLSQVYYGYTASAPKRDRERAQERYRVWWQSQGKRTKLGG
jgi:hypothetical protein